MIHREITIRVSGIDENAIEEAFNEAVRLLKKGCRIGRDENDEGSFYFYTEDNSDIVID